VGDSIETQSGGGNGGRREEPLRQCRPGRGFAALHSVSAASASLVAAAAPTRAEYVALVKSLAETYGGKLGAHVPNSMASLPSPVQALPPPSRPGSLYQRCGRRFGLRQCRGGRGQPRRPAGGQQPGVALDTIPDAKAASAVLLYARKLAPQQALPALNLAWVYFNSGHAPMPKLYFRMRPFSIRSLRPQRRPGMLASCKATLPPL